MSSMQRPCERLHALAVYLRKRVQECDCNQSDFYLHIYLNKKSKTFPESLNLTVAGCFDNEGWFCQLGKYDK